MLSVEHLIFTVHSSSSAHVCVCLKESTYLKKCLFNVLFDSQRERDGRVGYRKGKERERATINWFTPTSCCSPIARNGKEVELEIRTPTSWVTCFLPGWVLAGRWPGAPTKPSWRVVSVLSGDLTSMSHSHSSSLNVSNFWILPSPNVTRRVINYYVSMDSLQIGKGPASGLQAGWERKGCGTWIIPWPCTAFQMK